MERSKEAILSAVSKILDGQCAVKATQLLSDPDARFISSAPSRGTVGQILPSLRSRLINTVYTGKEIFGIGNLIDRFEKLESSTKIFGYSIASQRALTTIYFSEHDEAFGLALVDL